jgi:2-oxoisovalerate dehydrogenase E1 component
VEGQKQMSNYYSDSTPEFTPRTLDFGTIPAYSYQGDLAAELSGGTITKKGAIELYESMLIVREFEEMILKLRTGAYECIRDYEYRGPTHLSIGQEATAAGVCSQLGVTDYITSTHRGHGDSIAKGVSAILAMSDDELRARCPEFADLKGKALQDAVMEDHVFRTIAELFGKETGYGKGRGGGMHIADFRVGHLGANAIVGGGVPIATGAAMAARLAGGDSVVVSFAGDGAYANGVVLESLNWAAQKQFKELSDIGTGLPIVYCIVNNHYGMTGRCEDEGSALTTCMPKWSTVWIRWLSATRSSGPARPSPRATVRCSWNSTPTGTTDTRSRIRGTNTGPGTRRRAGARSIP